MPTKLFIALLPFIAVGCLAPFTDRLDLANAQAAQLNQQLVVATAKLDEATKILERSEQKLDEANKTFYRLENRIGDMDTKFTTIEMGFRKMFGIKGDDKKDKDEPPPSGHFRSENYPEQLGGAGPGQ